MAAANVPRGTSPKNRIVQRILEHHLKISYSLWGVFMTEDIKTAFKNAGIDLTDKQAIQFDAMTVFLQDYCTMVNLTAIRDREGIIEKHLVDSLLPLTLADVEKESRCIDIGTGAGFPAIPWLIYREDLRFILLDAQRKRTDYLTLLTEKLGIKAEIIHGRAEELGRKAGYRESCDVVTARAVSDIPTLLKYSAPFLKKGGKLLAMRGSRDELNGDTEILAEKLKLPLIAAKEYSLPKGDGRRLLIFVKK